jgi:hypothetical protein
MLLASISPGTEPKMTRCAAVPEARFALSERLVAGRANAIVAASPGDEAELPATLAIVRCSCFVEGGEERFARIESAPDAFDG